MGVSVPSLHREYTDSLIHVVYILNIQHVYYSLAIITTRYTVQCRFYFLTPITFLAQINKDLHVCPDSMYKRTCTASTQVNIGEARILMSVTNVIV